MTRFYLLCGQLKNNIVRMYLIHLKLVYKKFLMKLLQEEQILIMLIEQ